MILVGIDVAKDKHDCFISNSDGEVLFDVFTIPNSIDGFSELYEKISSVAEDLSKVKVGLEATGHYSYNILGFVLNKGLTTFVINPLHTNLFRKGQSLRKTKTDRIDARSIALMLLTDSSIEPYSLTSYHNEELKSLTRYRFTKVQERAKYKTSVTRLVNILFPELEKLVPTLHMKSIYALLSEFPGASHIASAHLTRLTHLLQVESKGRYGKAKAIEIREAARVSIGSVMPAKSLELSHTISLINILSNEIDEIEAEIKRIMDEISSPILSVPGISYRMGAMIIAEIGDFDRFPHRIRYWHTQVCPHRLTSLGSLHPHTLTWRSVDPNIFAMRCSTQRYMFAIGTRHSQPILLKNEPKASITMSPLLMQQRSLFA
jgi:transposase